jgi:hypothetical protein
LTQAKAAVKDQIENIQRKSKAKYNLIIKISKYLTLNNRDSLYYNKEVI